VSCYFCEVLGEDGFCRCSQFEPQKSAVGSLAPHPEFIRGYSIGYQEGLHKGLEHYIDSCQKQVSPIVIKADKEIIKQVLQEIDNIEKSHDTGISEALYTKLKESLD
jgi:hypothetical protein